MLGLSREKLVAQFATHVINTLRKADLTEKLRIAQLEFFCVFLKFTLKVLNSTGIKATRTLRSYWSQTRRCSALSAKPNAAEDISFSTFMTRFFLVRHTSVVKNMLKCGGYPGRAMYNDQSRYTDGGLTESPNQTRQRRPKNVD